MSFTLQGSSTDIFTILSAMVVGPATGGSKGAGTINATGLYVNGTAVGGGSTLGAVVNAGNVVNSVNANGQITWATGGSYGGATPEILGPGDQTMVISNSAPASGNSQGVYLYGGYAADSGGIGGPVDLEAGNSIGPNQNGAACLLSSGRSTGSGSDNGIQFNVCPSAYSNSSALNTTVQVSLLAGVQNNLSGTASLWTINPTWADGGNTSATRAQTFLINPTIDYTAASRTGSYQALVVNAVETSLPTGQNYLMLLQAGASGGTTEFSVTNAGIAQGFGIFATSGAASTTSTNGYVGTQGGAGVPTGVPATIPTGSVPLYVNTTAGTLYGYYGAAWNSLGGGGGTTYPVAPSGGTYTTSATGSFTVALGDTASASGNNSTVLGYGASDQGYQGCVAVGYLAEAGDNYATAVGDGAAAEGVDAVAIGSDNDYPPYAGGNGAIAIGGGSYVEGNFGIGIGSATVNSEYGVAIGNGSQVVGANGIAIGQNAYARDNQVVFGPGNFVIAADTGLITNYGGVSTTAWGVPAIYGYDRETTQTGAMTLATYTVGVADGSFWISANVNVTTYTAGAFTMTCSYTDETGASQTLTLNFSTILGVLGTSISAAGPFEGLVVRIRAQAGSTITVATTSGTFSGIYNAEADITEVA